MKGLKFGNFLYAVGYIILAVTLYAGWDSLLIIGPILAYSVLAFVVIVLLAGLVALLPGITLAHAWFNRHVSILRRDKVIADNEAFLSNNDLEVSNLSIDRARMQLELEQGFAWAAIEQVKTGKIHPSELGGIKLNSFPTPVIKQLVNEVTGELESPIVDLLPILKTCERLIIYGPSESGKTTLMRHLVDEKLSLGEVYVIDPHGNKPKWGHVNHVGQGRNFGKILRFIQTVTEDMTTRYDAEHADPKLVDNHPYTTVLVDELRAIVNDEVTKGTFGVHLAKLITEGRKVNIHIIIVAHTLRVKGMGIEGESDLLNGMGLVRLKGNKQIERSATYEVINFGDSYPVRLPGPYNEKHFQAQTSHGQKGRYNQLALPPTCDSQDTEVLETGETPSLEIKSSDELSPLQEAAQDLSKSDIEGLVIQEYLNSASYNTAYKKLHALTKPEKDLPKTLGKFQHDKVKAILDNWGITHPIDEPLPTMPLKVDSQQEKEAK